MFCWASQLYPSLTDAIKKAGASNLDGSHLSQPKPSRSSATAKVNIANLSRKKVVVAKAVDRRHWGHRQCALSVVLGLWDSHNHQRQHPR